MQLCEGAHPDADSRKRRHLQPLAPPLCRRAAADIGVVILVVILAIGLAAIRFRLQAGIPAIQQNGHDCKYGWRPAMTKQEWRRDEWGADVFPQSMSAKRGAQATHTHGCSVTNLHHLRRQCCRKQCSSAGSIAADGRTTTPLA